MGGHSRNWTHDTDDVLYEKEPHRTINIQLLSDWIIERQHALGLDSFERVKDKFRADTEYNRPMFNAM